MSAIVDSVIKNSIAEELGIKKGDKIVTVDGQVMSDMIDYNFFMKSELVTILVKHPNGEEEEIEIEKDFDEDLGIVFESAVFDKIKPCLNHCIFCFVDQQPKGLRDTLYVKDDDYRLSYLQGTYITLTNLKQADKERIKRMHLGPFYISVHTTNPELRVKMLRNPNAGKALENLQWFRKNKIPFHAQIVLCPGINDGKYKRVCCSDEFFLLAEEPIPPAKYYGNFCQLDDGVGSLRMTYDNFRKQKLPKSISKPFKIVFACSYAAHAMLEKIALKLSKIKNLEVKVCPVKSNYWGEDITVAGLITTEDLIRTVKNEECNIVVIPSVMLRPYTEDFLDGKNLSYVKKQSGKKFMIQQNIYSLNEVVDFIKTL